MLPKLYQHEQDLHTVVQKYNEMFEQNLPRNDEDRADTLICPECNKRTGILRAREPERKFDLNNKDESSANYVCLKCLQQTSKWDSVDKEYFGLIGEEGD